MRLWATIAVAGAAWLGVLAAAGADKPAEMPPVQQDMARHLDSLEPETFKAMARGDGLGDALRGMEAAEAAEAAASEL